MPRIRSYRLPLPQLDRERLPALRALRDSGIDGGALHHALGSPRLPPLTELTLDRCAGTDALCDAVAASPLAAGLRAVTLSDTMTLTGARTLAAAHDRLRLKRLDVTGNRLPNSARSVLEPMCRELAFGWQQGDAVLDLLPERYS